ncbi:hypothetical protein BR10RB9215_C10116 [Brucella sp. 10RB9215]|nr:hypothetical protein BR10RB9215_C10116 [Brucella sp. 10RB9215]
MGTLDFRFRRAMSVIAPGTNIITGLCRLFKIVVFHLILPFMAPLPSSKNKKGRALPRPSHCLNNQCQYIRGQRLETNSFNADYSDSRLAAALLPERRSATTS